jgi:hypothetical protein
MTPRHTVLIASRSDDSQQTADLMHHVQMPQFPQASLHVPLVSRVGNENQPGAGVLRAARPGAAGGIDAGRTVERSEAAASRETPATWSVRMWDGKDLLLHELDGNLVAAQHTGHGVEDTGPVDDIESEVVGRPQVVDRSDGRAP